MSLSDLISQFSLKSKSGADIEYLKSNGIGNVIHRALAETYKFQPNNPCRFIGTWLLNESRASMIKLRIEEKKQVKDQLIQELALRNKAESQNKLKIEENLNLAKTEKDKFNKMILDNNDMEEILDAICEGSKSFTGSNGCYISYLDKKQKNTVLTAEDDEESHQFNDLPEVLRYIAYCNDHKFLKGKCLEPEQGISHDLFKPKENVDDVNPNPELDQDGNPIEQIEEKEIIPNHILIGEVVREKRMKFFKEPRLGCYLAVDISYRSSLNKDSLDTAIEYYYEFVEEEKKIEEEKAEYLKNKANESVNSTDKDMNMNEGGDENNNKNNTTNNPENEEQNEILNKKAILKDFERKEKKLVFSYDTLGQDRIYNEENKKFIFDLSKLIVNHWEDQEKTKLLINRDLRISNKEKERKWLEENSLEKIPDLEDQEFRRYISEKYPENPPTDEDERNVEANYSKSRYILKIQLLENEILANNFLDFAKYEFIEHEKLFQNIFYFIGIDHLEINLEHTNKLDWKRARKLWNKSVIDGILDYNPYGPKPKMNDFAMINRILRVLADCDEEKIREGYSYVLSRLLEVVRLCKFFIRKNIYFSNYYCVFWLFSYFLFSFY